VSAAFRRISQLVYTDQNVRRLSGLAAPELQWPIPGRFGSLNYLDLALPCCRFAVEYDGEAFHGDDRRKHDRVRREWIEKQHNWVVLVLRRHNVFGHEQDAIELIRAAYAACPSRCARHTNR